MSKTNASENNIHMDTINKEKMNFRILNRYPENNLKNSKDVEKRLFEIFKKYEKKIEISCRTMYKNSLPFRA